MPTNEERRQIAAKLRNAEIENIGLTYSAHLGEATGECVRLVSGHEGLVTGGLNRLADLIEPHEHICLGCIKWSAIEGNPVKGVCAEFSDPEDGIERATPYYGFCYEWEGE